MTQVRQPGGARASGAHLVYVELKRRILDLELAPGERLHEPALTAELGVSRTPLREAVRRLIAENLLEQQPTGAVLVPRLDARDVVELYEVRASLEGLMAGTAARRATGADHDALHGLLARNEALVHFRDDAMAAGTAIHDRIGEIADNAWARHLHRQVTDQMRRYKLTTNSSEERRAAALSEHHDICAAIIAGDDVAAADLASRHVLGARDVAVRALGEPGPDAAAPGADAP
ncbi:GntR family transcriptional regulator [Marmoricola sp. Leaf446]|uniref:GntR family transcriptional regulator n=1 Tax=Marmoricola sp. Leaf446 TaxID=1736379 RepID=UPI0006F9CED7|nr:GntR family transcriptional regulator [Marmoricola sp. Leaf446]KQT93538.1 GntR family transcriptional regulator [Marmoricola sp. Leaf446]